MRYIAYYRVSTEKQGQSGLGLEAQRETVARAIEGKDLLGEYVEVESGAKNERPQLLEAVDHAKAANAVLVIARLDRLSRNLAFIATMMDSEVEFLCCDNPHATKFTLHILAAMAEHERDLISQRTTAALAAAKRRGVKLGGLRHDLGRYASQGGQASAVTRGRKADNHARRIAKAVERLGEVDEDTRLSELRRQGFTSPSGKTLTTRQVDRALTRHRRMLTA